MGCCCQTTRATLFRWMTISLCVFSTPRWDDRIWKHAVTKCYCASKKDVVWKDTGDLNCHNSLLCRITTIKSPIRFLLSEAIWYVNFTTKPVSDAQMCWPPKRGENWILRCFFSHFDIAIGNSVSKTNFAVKTCNLNLLYWIRHGKTKFDDRSYKIWLFDDGSSASRVSSTVVAK